MSIIEYESLKAVLTADGVINGKVCMTELSEMIETYYGPTDVTPKITAQTLDTSNKYLTDDVSIKPIPFYSVDNEDNGQTIIIGEEI